jgi:hypothetical protein
MLQCTQMSIANQSIFSIVLLKYNSCCKSSVFAAIIGENAGVNYFPACRNGKNAADIRIYGTGAEAIPLIV